MRVLIVEDEKSIADALKFSLAKEGIDTDLAMDGEEGLDMCYAEIYDIIMLDRMLPKRDGLSILTQIRKDKIETPVIIVSAKDTVEDRIDGLSAGADDYLVKPFATKELVARLRAIARRRPLSIITDNMIVQDIEFSPSKSEIKSIKTDEIISLTFKEAQILELLIYNKNNVIKRETIYEKIWGYDSEIESNSLEAYISYLRKKLTKLTDKVQLKTIRGIGYTIMES